MLPAGSQVKTGFQIYAGLDVYTSQADLDAIQNTVEGCVYASGGFDSVSVSVEKLNWASTEVYTVVAVQTINDHAALGDVGAWIKGAIQACAPDLQIVRTFDTVGVGATDSQGNPLPQGGGGNTPPPPPGTCDYSKMTFGDWLACETGFTKSTSLLLGVAVTLGVLFAISSRR